MTAKDELRDKLEKALEAGDGPTWMRYALAAAGSIPVAGGAVAGVAGVWSEREQAKFNRILAAWLKLHEDELREIGITLAEVMARLDLTDEKIRERVESPEYLSLIKKTFRDWSASESEEKRRLIRNLLANAAASSLTTDDVIRLFIEWIDKFSELHFKVVREIHKQEHITRYQIWQELSGVNAREDSAEADLFKLIFHDLSTGHVIRQHRPVDAHGNFIPQSRKKPVRGSTTQFVSAFDDTKPYVLTDLGRQFIHYTMNEIVPKITAGDETV